MNLFKKYFDEQKEEKQSKKEGKSQKKEILKVSKQSELDAFLQSRLQDDLGKFQRLVEEEINEQNLKEFIEEIIVEKAESIEVVTADSLQKEGNIPTGSINFDSLLGGGISISKLTEFFGSSGVGKTQLLFQIIAKNVQEHEIIFVDTESTFSPSRITQLLEYHGENSSEGLLKRIHYLRLNDFKEQIASLKVIEGLLRKKPNVRIILIDSLTNLFRSRLWGKDLIMIRQQLLNYYISELRNIAENYKVAIAVTNQVLSSPTEENGPWEMKAVGGNIIQHGIQTRVMMQKRQNEKFIAKIISSSHLHPNSVEYTITKIGID